MKDLKMFEWLHKKPLTLGMKVRINTQNQYAADWPDEYIVVGMQYMPLIERTNVSITERLDDGPTDGWIPDDLVPVDSDEKEA